MWNFAVSAALKSHKQISIYILYTRGLVLRDIDYYLTPSNCFEPKPRVVPEICRTIAETASDRHSSPVW